MNDKYDNIPPYINISTMAELLQLSRSRLYQLTDQGVLLKPVYLVANKRPVYTKEMVVRNLEVKHDNVGINKKIVMFYSARPAPKPAKAKRTTKEQAEQPAVSPSRHTEMIEALEALGLENVSSSQIDSAILKCFPDGTEDVSEDEILREVFRHMNRRNSEHKQRT
jgi:hypothetical protein